MSASPPIAPPSSLAALPASDLGQAFSCNKAAALGLRMHYVVAMGVQGMRAA